MKIFRETSCTRETYNSSSILVFETEINRNFSKNFENNVNTDFYVPSWTFKSKKVFFSVRKISVFWNFCWSLTEKIWNFSAKTPWQGYQNRISRVQRNDFLENKLFFWEKSFSFQVLIVKEKIMTPAKVFSEGCLKSTLRFQLIAFTIKTFFEIFLLLHLFRTSSGKKFQLWTYFFCKAVNVHSTYSDEHFLEKKFFLGMTINFHQVWTWKQKYFEKSWKSSENNVYAE